MATGSNQDAAVTDFTLSASDIALLKGILSTLKGGSGGKGEAVVITDPTAGNQAAVLLFHTADNQVPGGSAFGILTGGVAQMINQLGNLDRQRETGLDNVAATGIASGNAYFLMQALTTDTTDTFTAGTRTFTPVLMTGTFLGIPWTIAVGSILILDVGAQQETVQVTAVTATTFTCVTTKTHTATFQIAVNVYNQERDFAGEGSLASGQGAAVAQEYEYNGGGPGNQNIDATRNLMGKLWSTVSISAGGGAASTSITAGSAPTGLQPGQWIYCTGGAGPNEWVQVAKNYVLASTTIPLVSALVNGHIGGTVGFDNFGDLTAGAGSSIVGEGAEGVWLYDHTVTTGPALFLQRPNLAVTLLASASRTTTQTSADLVNINGHYLEVILDVTVIGTGSVTVTINGKDPASGKYFLLLAGAAVAGNSTNVYKIGPALPATANVSANDFVPRVFQIVVTANNANAVTYSVGYNLNE